MNRERYLERARIAFGMNAQARGPALKAWNTKWNTTSGGSYYKAVQIGSAAKSYRAPSPLPPPFGVEYATDHSTGSMKGLASVQLRSDGATVYAGGFPVEHITSAGVGRYGAPLVRLDTKNGSYIVERTALHLKG